jgi:hypothetical protein
MRFTRSSLQRLIKILLALVLGAIIITYAIWRSLNYARGPEIVIFEPANGSATASSTIVIRGQALRINNLTVNGMPLFISEDGHFGNVIIVFPGTNRITIAGRDQFGRETSTLLEIVGENEFSTAMKDLEVQIVEPVATSTGTTTGQ